jgi:hypothetical protein
MFDGAARRRWRYAAFRRPRQTGVPWCGQASDKAACRARASFCAATGRLRLDSATSSSCSQCGEDSDRAIPTAPHVPGRRPAGRGALGVTVDDEKKVEHFLRDRPAERHAALQLHHLLRAHRPCCTHFNNEVTCQHALPLSSHAVIGEKLTAKNEIGFERIHSLSISASLSYPIVTSAANAQAALVRLGAAGLLSLCARTSCAARASSSAQLGSGRCM